MNVIAAFVSPLIALIALIELAARGKPADLIDTSSIAATGILPRLRIYASTTA